MILTGNGWRRWSLFLSCQLDREGERLLCRSIGCGELAGLRTRLWDAVVGISVVRGKYIFKTEQL
jgi:hypothetical protein